MSAPPNEKKTQMAVEPRKLGPPPESPYMLDPEAAAYVRLSPSRFRYHAAQSGLTTPYRRGPRGARLWTREILDAWLVHCSTLYSEQSRTCADRKEKSNGARRYRDQKAVEWTVGDKGERGPSKDPNARLGETAHHGEEIRSQGEAGRASRGAARKTSGGRSRVAAISSEAQRLRRVVAEVKGTAREEIGGR